MKERIKDFFVLEGGYFCTFIIMIIVTIIIGLLSIPFIYEGNIKKEQAANIKKQELNRVIAKEYNDTIAVNGVNKDIKITVSYIKGSDTLEVVYE